MWVRNFIVTFKVKGFGEVFREVGKKRSLFPQREKGLFGATLWEDFFGGLVFGLFFGLPIWPYSHPPLYYYSRVRPGGTVESNDL